MINNKKEVDLGEYFRELKTFIILFFIISIIQIVLLFLKVSQNLVFSISVIEAFFLIYIGYRYTEKNGFDMKKIAIVSLVMLISAILYIIFAVGVMTGNVISFSASFIALLLLNYPVNFILVLLGSLFAKKK